jgi:hypothetical protein
MKETIKAKEIELKCPNCHIELSYCGGTTSGSMDFRICWECKYEVVDIKNNVEIEQTKI